MNIEQKPKPKTNGWEWDAWTALLDEAMELTGLTSRDIAIEMGVSPGALAMSESKKGHRLGSALGAALDYYTKLARLDRRSSGQEELTMLMVTPTQMPHLVKVCRALKIQILEEK